MATDTKNALNEEMMQVDEKYLKEYCGKEYEEFMKEALKEAEEQKEKGTKKEAFKDLKEQKRMEFIETRIADDKKRLILAAVNTQEGFKAVDNTKKIIKKNLATINDKRDETLNKEMMKVSDEYLKRRYGQRYEEFLGEGSDEEKNERRKEFVKTEINMSEKLIIISQHRNNMQIETGDDKFSADLSEAQKIKTERKQRYKKDAADLYADYKKILDDNEVLIERFQKEIDDLQANISNARQSLIQLNSEGASKLDINSVGGSQTKTKTTEDVEKSIKNIEENIKNWEKQMNEKLAVLGKIKTLQQKYGNKLKARENEINTLLEEGKIFNGQEPILETKESEKASNKMTTTENNLSNPKYIAKAMLEDFYRARTPQQRRMILAQCGSKDFLYALEHAGMINKMRIKATLKDEIDNMEDDKLVIQPAPNGVTVGNIKNLLRANSAQQKLKIGKVSITREEMQALIVGKDDDTQLDLGEFEISISKETLKNMFSRKNSISDKQILAMKDEVEDFIKNIGSKNMDEIMEFEDKIQYLRYASFLQETGFMRRFTRFFDFMNPKRRKVFEIENTLAEYASEKDKREKNALQQENKWRKTLKIPARSDISMINPEALDRTGKDKLLNQDYEPMEM